MTSYTIGTQGEGWMSGATGDASIPYEWLRCGALLLQHAIRLLPPQWLPHFLGLTTYPHEATGKPWVEEFKMFKDMKPTVLQEWRVWE